MIPPYLLRSGALLKPSDQLRADYLSAQPFPHLVLDNFLPDAQARFLLENFPNSESDFWLDWRVRSGAQYKKQGPGSADRFDALDPLFEAALEQFNGHRFLRYLEAVTGIEKLLPDPYFSGGGLHQILKDGILDIHTDFNRYERLNLFRRLNVLIYLNIDCTESDGGALELWNGPPPEGQCVKSIIPLFNRCVIFQTDKTSFHGHPVPWAGNSQPTRRSIALYYYTSEPVEGLLYNTVTDFQGVTFRDPVAG